MKLNNFTIIIAIFISGFIQAENIEEIYRAKMDGRQWGFIGLDTDDFLVVDCASGPIEGALKRR